MILHAPPLRTAGEVGEGITTMTRYKWNTAHEWLLEKAQEYARANNAAELLSIIDTLVPKLDSDTIQDEFESEMDADGYFDDLDAKPEDDENEEGDE